MREVFKTSMRDPGARAIVKAAFPGYHGRTIKFVVTDSPQHFTTWWDGGSKDDVAAVELSSMRAIDLPESSPYKQEGISMEIYHRGVAPRPNIALVNHSIFCGKDAGITIYIHPENAPKLLPASGSHRGN